MKTIQETLVEIDERLAACEISLRNDGHESESMRWVKAGIDELTRLKEWILEIK